MLKEDCSREVYQEKLLRLSTFVDFIQSRLRCIRQILLLYLDEVWNNDCLSVNQLPCSVCQNAERKLWLDVSEETYRVLRFLDCHSLIRELDVVDVLSGIFYQYGNLKWVYGSLKHWCRSLVVFFIQELRLRGLIENKYEMVDDVPLGFLVITEVGKHKSMG